MAEETRKAQDELLKDAWMIRPCEDFKEEYKECKSIRGKFHQYYTNGELKDCSRWKEDYNLCQQYREYRSLDAFLKLLDHERERIVARVKDATDNDVWEYRTEPPEDWNKPLPPSLLERPVPAAPNKRCVIQ